MPPRHGRFSRQVRRPAPRAETSAGIQFERRIIPQPHVPVLLQGPSGTGTASERWELVCRDGWDWRQVKPGQVAVRVATLTVDQANVVQEWLQRLKQPAFWWATSRELNSPGTSAEVADAIARAPWLSQVLPVLLEASTEGAPPPPPE